MSQLMNDDRIKGYVQEILEDEKRLPTATHTDAPALPPAGIIQILNSRAASACGFSSRKIV